MMVRMELEQTLDAIAGGENLRVIVFKLLTWAESNGCVSDLIAGAIHQTPGNPLLQQLVKDARSWGLPVQTTTPPTTHHSQPHRSMSDYHPSTQQCASWEDENEIECYENESNDSDEIHAYYSDRFVARFPTGHLNKSFILGNVQGTIEVRKSAYNDIAIDEVSNLKMQPTLVLEMSLSVNGRSNAAQIYLVTEEQIKRKVQAYDKRVKAFVAKNGYKNSIVNGPVIINYEIKKISYTQSPNFPTSSTLKLAGFDEVIVESIISLRNH